LDALLIVMLAVERHADAYASVVFYRLVAFVVIVFVLVAPISLALDDEAATTSWDETLKDCREFLGYLLEGTLYGLILALIKIADEFFDGLPGGIKIFATFNEFFPLLSEVGILLESLFVDMLIFL
jgi:hypothetical protein